MHANQHRLRATEIPFDESHMAIAVELVLEYRQLEFSQLGYKRQLLDLLHKPFVTKPELDQIHD